jgi:hypothetical protein
VTRCFQRPRGSISAYVGAACGVGAVALCGCGDLIGVGSLSGDATAAAAAGDERVDATRDDVGVDAVAAGLDDAAVAVERDAASGSDDGSERTACASDSGVGWVSWSYPTVPIGAFYVGFEPMTESDPEAGSYYYYVCRSRDDSDGGDIIPGMFVDTFGCFYTPDGVHQFQSSSYDVLIDPDDCLVWTTYDGGLASAVVGGQLGQVPLYVCSAPLNRLAPWWQAGYLEGAPNTRCRVPTQGGTPEDIAANITVVTQ